VLISLIKNDLKSSYRELFPLYLGLIIFAILSSLSINYQIGLFSMVTVMPFVGLFIGTIVILIITIVKLFTTRLYSNEGYLTFTLPVSTLDIFLAKIITVIIWVVVTILVYMLAVGIFGGILTLMNWSDIQVAMNQYRHYWQSISWSSFSMEALRAIAISLPQFIASIAYASALFLLVVVFANTSFIAKHKLAVAVVLYLVVSFILGLPKTYVFGDWLTATGNYNFSIDWIKYSLSLIYDLLITVGLLAGSVWLNDHKLELE